MVGLCVPFPARGGCFGVGRSETFQTLSLSLSNASAYRRDLTRQACFRRLVQGFGLIKY